MKCHPLRRVHQIRRGTHVCRSAPASACPASAATDAAGSPAIHPIPGGQGPYRLPRECKGSPGVRPWRRIRNRESAFALAVFLARFWSTPSRIVDAFPIDRRELAEHGELDLTEKRIRSAIRTLEEVGFLDRALRLRLTLQGDGRRSAAQAHPVHVRLGLCPCFYRRE